MDPYTSQGRTGNLEPTVQELRIQLTDSQQKADQKEDGFNEIIKSLGAMEESSSVFIAPLTRVSSKFTSIRYPNHASNATVQQKDSLNQTITSLREDLHTQQTNSGAFVDHALIGVDIEVC